MISAESWLINKCCLLTADSELCAFNSVNYYCSNFLPCGGNVHTRNPVSTFSESLFTQLRFQISDLSSYGLYVAATQRVTLPMTSLRLSLSLSMTVMMMVVSLSTWAATSKGNDSLKTGFRQRFIVTVFFFSTRLSLCISHTFTYGSAMRPQETAVCVRAREKMLTEGVFESQVSNYPLNC